MVMAEVGSVAVGSGVAVAETAETVEVDAAAAAVGSAEEKVETVETAVVVVADSEGSVVDLGAVKAVAVDSAAGGSEVAEDSVGGAEEGDSAEAVRKPSSHPQNLPDSHNGG